MKENSSIKMINIAAHFHKSMDTKNFVPNPFLPVMVVKVERRNDDIQHYCLYELYWLLQRTC